MMVFQEFDQLLPWKTVTENVMFPLVASGRLAGRRGTGEGAGGDREGQSHQVRRQPAAHALRGNEAAGGDRARHGDGA
jgi:ABC-type taurine transport system ATPase subunit